MSMSIDNHESCTYYFHKANLVPPCQLTVFHVTQGINITTLFENLNYLFKTYLQPITSCTINL